MDMRRADVLMGRDESPLLLVLTEVEEEVGIVVRKKRGWGGRKKRVMRVQVQVQVQGGEERRMKR